MINKKLCEKENLVFDSPLYLEPVERFKNRSNVMKFRSFGDSLSSRVKDKLKTNRLLQSHTSSLESRSSLSCSLIFRRVRKFIKMDEAASTSFNKKPQDKGTIRPSEMWFLNSMISPILLVKSRFHNIFNVIEPAYQFKLQG